MNSASNEVTVCTPTTPRVPVTDVVANGFTPCLVQALPGVYAPCNEVLASTHALESRVIYHDAGPVLVYRMSI